MPKAKTKSSAKKRFKVSANGKIIRFKAGKSHLLTHKKRKRKRNLRKPTVVDSGSYGRIKECMPHSF